MDWRQIRDPQDPELDRLAELYRLHPLHIEDCRHRNQSAKVEESRSYMFAVLKTVEIASDGSLALADLDVFLGRDFIITVEDPVEYKIANVTQIEVNTKSGNTFANSLRSILRQDPDVVMIGEIRDAETAKIACQAANTGHMVFSTVHSNDAVTALSRLLDLGVEPFMIASALSGVLGQRLVRILCEACKEPYKPKPEFLKKANLPVEKVDVFYRRPENPEQVCQQCGGTGYFGRTGIYELLVLNETMKDMIRENPSINKIKAEARKNGMIYLQEDGLRQVIQGRTSIEELLRVVK